MSASAYVDERRLAQRLAAMARIGATGNGGVNRQALSAEDAAAQRQLVLWGEALGLRPSIDAIGNLFLRLEGADTGAPPVLSGSHLDSQPTGGKFDGAFGVLAALEAVEAIIASAVKPRVSIDIVAWMNEEGSRFAPGMMGSAVFAGDRALDATLAAVDKDDVSVKQALARCARPCATCPSACWENAYRRMSRRTSSKVRIWRTKGSRSAW